MRQAMTKDCKPGAGMPHIQQEVENMLRARGLPAASVPALLDFDMANFQWHRHMVKGDMLRVILTRLDRDLDVAHFHALTALLRVRYGVGRDAAEPTIGLIAEELNVDPSRASRLITALVARGFVRREVAQADGRKAVLSPTDAGKAVLDAFRAEKWQIMADVFKDWQPEAIAQFAGAIRSYMAGVQAVLGDLAAPEAAEPRDDAAAPD